MIEERASEMNVLVTGATGFIGRHLVERLTQEGHHIRVLVLPEEDRSALEPVRMEIVRGDVCDFQTVERAAVNCQLIFHLAAKTEDSGASRKAL